MKVVVDYVHSKNLSFGLYTCSGLTTCVGGRPGSYGHWQQDADVFAEWGVDVSLAHTPAKNKRAPLTEPTNTHPNPHKPSSG